MAIPATCALAFTIPTRMGGILITGLGLVGYILPVPSLIWGWVAWFKSQQRSGSPWRFVAALIGLGVASVIGLFVLVVIVWIGGMPESGPKYEYAMKSCGVGLLASTLALVLSLVGKGPVRLPSLLSSIGLAAFWLVAALTY